MTLVYGALIVKESYKSNESYTKNFYIPPMPQLYF